MAGKKLEAFAGDLVDLAQLAKVLGHPGRLEILRILSGQACICGDIVERMPLSQATVSQHLKELKTAGLIRGEITGPRICYGIDRAALERARAAFVKLFADLDCCPGEGVSCEERG